MMAARIQLKLAKQNIKFQIRKVKSTKNKTEQKVLKKASSTP